MSLPAPIAQTMRLGAAQATDPTPTQGWATVGDAAGQQMFFQGVVDLWETAGWTVLLRGPVAGGTVMMLWHATEKQWATPFVRFGDPAPDDDYYTPGYDCPWYLTGPDAGPVERWAGWASRHVVSTPHASRLAEVLSRAARWVADLGANSTAGNLTFASAYQAVSLLTRQALDLRETPCAEPDAKASEELKALLSGPDGDEVAEQIGAWQLFAGLGTFDAPRRGAQRAMNRYAARTLDRLAIETINQQIHTEDGCSPGTCHACQEFTAALHKDYRAAGWISTDEFDEPDEASMRLYWDFEADQPTDAFAAAVTAEIEIYLGTSTARGESGQGMSEPRPHTARSGLQALHGAPPRDLNQPFPEAPGAGNFFRHDIAEEPDGDTFLLAVARLMEGWTLRGSVRLAQFIDQRADPGWELQGVAAADAAGVSSLGPTLADWPITLDVWSREVQPGTEPEWSCRVGLDLPQSAENWEWELPTRRMQSLVGYSYESVCAPSRETVVEMLDAYLAEGLVHNLDWSREQVNHPARRRLYAYIRTL